MSTISDTNTCLPNDHEAIGAQLQEMGCGGLLPEEKILEHGHRNLFFISPPPSPELSVIIRGTVVFASSVLIRKLCELNENSKGHLARWNCQMKEKGRYFARCSSAGCPRKSKSKGFRLKQSKKVGCHAFLATTMMENVYDEETCHRLVQFITSNSPHFVKSLDDSVRLDQSMFCVVRKIQMNHSNHILDLIRPGTTSLQRTKDITENEEIMNAIKAFRSACPSGRGSVMRLSKYLMDRFPGYNLETETLRNVIRQLSENEFDAENLVRYLQSARDQQRIEFLDYEVDTDTKVLSSITWAAGGSADVVSRCSDVLFWDSTHNTTHYDYRLVTFTIVDSEGVSRSVLISLTLCEDVKYCKRILALWHEAFKVQLPPVIMTDGDSAMALAIQSVPYAIDLKHLLCIYHLFDINLKKRVLSSLSSAGGASAWEVFRASLSTCRECTTEDKFVELWENLMDEWFPPGTRYQRARSYLQRYVWDTREKWACAFFTDSMTLGASSTQRAESWNSLVRCFTDSTSLSNYASSILSLVEGQSKLEKKSRSPQWRLVPLSNVSGFIRQHIFECLSCFGLSRYACNEVTEQLEDAHNLSFLEDTSQDENEFNQLEYCHVSISGTTSKTYEQPKSIANHQLPSTTMVQMRVYIRRGRSASEKPNVEVSCECLYLVRMGIPCRHLLAVCLHLDRSKRFLNELQTFGYPSFINTVLVRTISRRWISPKLMTEAETREVLSQTKSFDIDEEKQQRIEQLDSWFAECGVKRCYSPTNSTSFPVSLSGNGGNTAFSLVRSTFSRIAENISSCSEGLWAGRIVHEIGKLLVTETNVISNSAGKIVPSEQLPTLCHLACILNEVDGNKIVQKNSMDAEEGEEETCEDALDVESRSNFAAEDDDSCAEEKGENKTDLKDPGPPPFVSQTLPDLFSSSGIESSSDRGAGFRRRKLEASKRAHDRIRTPRKRHDHSRLNLNSVVLDKTRSARRRKLRRSRTVPKLFRAVNKETKLLPRPTIEGYKCPLCDEIGIQSHPQHVRQHFAHKHFSEVMGMPSIGQMMVHSDQDARRMKSGRSAKTVCKSNDTCSDVASNLQTEKAFLPQAVIRARNKIGMYCPRGRKREKYATKNTFDRFSLADLSEQCVVQIFWHLDLKWYQGKVTRVSDDNETVEILYDDGDRDVLRGSELLRCRKVLKGNAQPTPSFIIERKVQVAFDRTNSIIQNEEQKQKPKDIIVTEGEIDVLSIDFKSLYGTAWLTDSVIEAFIVRMMRISKHEEDDRFLFLSPFCFSGLSDGDSTRSARKWMYGIELHDVDGIIWPINVQRSHWILCYVHTHDQSFVLLDPFEVDSKTIRDSSLTRNVINTLSNITANYFQKYGGIPSWKELAPSTMSEKLRLPKQPKSNTNDCGVLICLYAWAILVGKPFPPLSTLDISFQSLMTNCRVIIGGTISM